MVLGLMTIVSMWQPTSVVLEPQALLVPPSPSSQVRKTAAVPVRYSLLLKMVGKLSANHLSPWAVVPLCMSSFRLGVTNEKAGKAFWPDRSPAPAHPDDLDLLATD